MSAFFIRFAFCNLFISVAIGLLLIAKHLLRNVLTSRMQYNLWFLLFGLLIVPFLPIRLNPLSIFLWFSHADVAVSASPAPAFEQTVQQNGNLSTGWINDFHISASQELPPVLGILLGILWISGGLIVLFAAIRARLHFRAIKKSSLPLENPQVQALYHSCLQELGIKRTIPVRSTAYLKSPVIEGLFLPCIYLPLPLVCGNDLTELRYMLLHELSHHKHRDAISSYFMNVSCIVYWFHPLIWHVVKEIQSDREIACDAAVLKLLTEDSYLTYGNTLINFAERMSFTPFPFALGIGGSRTQMKKRIRHIAGYQPASTAKRLRGILACFLVFILLSSFVPALSLHAADSDRYSFNQTDSTITSLDLDAFFDGGAGSFVLYDSSTDLWQIYNMDLAVTRIAPASTFKPYSALLGLEAGILSPSQTELLWDGTTYPYESWNGDQTLYSAMQDSVSWYFQSIDKQLGLSTIRSFVRDNHYGNQTVSGESSSYWINSSLRISPIEQVEMLIKLYYNDYLFNPEHIQMVKNSLFLLSTADGSLYGKTGTIEYNQQNTTGWFIGFLEKENHVYFFATDIHNKNGAAGSTAVQITLSALSDLALWGSPQDEVYR